MYTASFPEFILLRKENRLPDSRQIRIHAALPVRVTWTDAGETKNLSACTIDVSQTGARLTGVTGLQAPGQRVAIRRKISEAQFRVVWIGKPKTPHEGQVGVECVEADKVIWDVDFAKVQEEFEPLDMSSKPRDTSRLRYTCEGRVLVWPELETAGGIEAQLRTISPFFCELSGAKRFLGPLLLQILADDVQVTVKGIAREAANDDQSWVDFTEIRRGDRQELQNLISRISAKRILSSSDRKQR